MCGTCVDRAAAGPAQFRPGWCAPKEKSKEATRRADNREYKNVTGETSTVNKSLGAKHLSSKKTNVARRYG